MPAALAAAVHRPRLPYSLLPQCCYSPDEKYVLTGTSAEGKDSSGALVVLSADSLDKLGEVAVDGSAVAVQVRANNRPVLLLPSTGSCCNPPAPPCAACLPR